MESRLQMSLFTLVSHVTPARRTIIHLYIRIPNCHTESTHCSIGKLISAGKWVCPETVVDLTSSWRPERPCHTVSDSLYSSALPDCLTEQVLETVCDLRLQRDLAMPSRTHSSLLYSLWLFNWACFGNRLRSAIFGKTAIPSLTHLSLLPSLIV